MKRRSYSKLIMFMIVSTLWFCPGEAVSASIEFEIRPVKSAYMLAEPVFIDFTLKNAGPSGTVTATPEITVETELVSVYIAVGSGKFKRYDPGFVEEPSRLPVELGPGNKVVHRQLVLYDNASKDYAFPASGLYRVKAVFHRLGAAPDIESNTVQIRVTDPAETDAAALNLFKSKIVAQLIMNLNEDSEAVTRLESLMTEHGSTTYGKYAQFYLARLQTREFFTRKPNHERAVELYRDLIRKDPKFPLVMDAKYRLGLSLMKTGRYKEAREIFNFVLKKSQLTRHRKGAEKLMGRIEKHKDKKSR